MYGLYFDKIMATIERCIYYASLITLTARLISKWDGASRLGHAHLISFMSHCLMRPGNVDSHGMSPIRGFSDATSRNNISSDKPAELERAR